MSAAIRKSLNTLNKAVEKLEGAIESKKAASATGKKSGQTSGTPDLFSSTQPSMNPMNVRMLATRLDTAINQVEQILKEGRR